MEGLTIPYNGAGIFTRNFSWIADKNSAIPITASRMDADSNDFVTAFNNTLTRDGQGVASAPLPMAGFRHTGVGNGVALNDYAALGQLQNNGVKFAVAGGTADALTATLAPVPVLVDGFELLLRAAAANATTTPTLALNGGTARTITKLGGAAVVAHDIVGNLHELILRYNLANTRWELLNAGTNVPSSLSDPASLTGSTAGAGSGPTFNLLRNKGSAASANDLLAIFNFQGENTTPAAKTFAAVLAKVITATATTEAGELHLQTIIAGAIADRLILGAGLFSTNATGGDKGADTANFSNIYRNGGLIDRRVPAVHATSYTQVATDEFVELVANSGGAVAWTMMSGATFGAGGIQYVSCDVAGTVLTLTRAGSDTFASGGSTALATLVLNAGDRGYLVCDGGSPAIWRFHGIRHYDSGQQTITSAGSLTLAHSLGVQPGDIQVYLHNTTGESGYSAGDEVQQTGQMDAANSRGVVTVPDATNLNIRFGSSANTFSFLNKTTGAGFTATNANWKTIWRAWVYN